VRSAGGLVLEAGSVGELCQQLFTQYGVPAAPAAQTIQAFDEAAQRDDPGRLDIPRRQGLHRIGAPPFYAVPVRPGVTFTEGGVRANRDGEAVDDIGLAVPGLYVAGADVGGISVEGYIGGLSVGLISGLRAGINAARHVD
jgi:succinate dehydrogenase/fumarate reductase flavoprotein subunit